MWSSNIARSRRLQERGSTLVIVAGSMIVLLGVGAQNLVAGQAASILGSDITFSYPNAEEPQITVAVARDAGHGNAMPTIFGKIFGLTTVNISVSATAEVFNPSG